MVLTNLKSRSKLFMSIKAQLQTVTCLIELLAIEPYYQSNRKPGLLKGAMSLDTFSSNPVPTSPILIPTTGTGI